MLALPKQRIIYNNEESEDKSSQVRCGGHLQSWGRRTTKSRPAEKTEYDLISQETEAGCSGQPNETLSQTKKTEDKELLLMCRALGSIPNNTRENRSKIAVCGGAHL